MKYFNWFLKHSRKLLIHATYRVNSAFFIRQYVTFFKPCFYLQHFGLENNLFEKKVRVQYSFVIILAGLTSNFSFTSLRISTRFRNRLSRVGTYYRWNLARVSCRVFNILDYLQFGLLLRWKHDVTVPRGLFVRTRIIRFDASMRKKSDL